jgi:hypothetical protein
MIACDERRRRFALNVAHKQLWARVHVQQQPRVHSGGCVRQVDGQRHARALLLLTGGVQRDVGVTAGNESEALASWRARRTLAASHSCAASSAPQPASCCATAGERAARSCSASVEGKSSSRINCNVCAGTR